MKKLFTLVVLTILLVSCGGNTNTVGNSGLNSLQDENTPTETKQEQQKIVTSIIPLASITNAIGGDAVAVTNLVEAGQSPHSFDLSTQDMVAINESNAVFLLGLDHIDGFLDKAVEAEGKNHLILSEGLTMIEGGHDDHDHDDEHHDEDIEEHHEDKAHDDEHEDEHHEDEHEDHEEETHADEETDEHHDEHEDHEEGEEAHEMDPHVWNSPKNAVLIAGKIKDYLSKIYPERSDYFEANYKIFAQDLESQTADFKTATEGKEQAYFIVFHDAYTYLFADLGIDEEKKLTFRTNVLEDPNSTEMKELIDAIDEHNITVAFTEPQFSSSSLSKLAKEKRIELKTLNPLGTETTANGYVGNLRENLENLISIFK